MTLLFGAVTFAFGFLFALFVVAFVNARTYAKRRRYRPASVASGYVPLRPTPPPPPKKAPRARRRDA